VNLPKFLDSSLIDVDIHPTYVSVVIKGKLLRLTIPSEVKVAESKCQRSKLTGSLKVIMPKVNSKEITLTSRPIETKKATSSTRTRVVGTKKESLQEQMMREAAAASQSKAVDIRGIVKQDDENDMAGDINDMSIASKNPIQEANIQEL
jgi:protein TilB